MGVKCGKCGEEVPGVVSQDTLTERLRAKDVVNAELKAQLAEVPKLREKATAYDTLQAQVEGERVERERAAAFDAAGVKDAAVQARLARYYAAEVDGVEDPPSLADWLAAPETVAIFGAHLGGAAAAAAPKGAPAPKPPAAKGVPVEAPAARSVGAAPPGPPSTPSISDLLASAKYRAAKPKERLALLAEFREHLTSAADAG